MEAASTNVLRVLGGKYVLIRQIGRGGYGVVYEARDQLLDRTVAIKTIRPELFEADDRVERIRRFRDEGRVTARLSHPHIVSLYGAAFDRNEAYIVMELVPGRPLSAILTERKRLPLDEVLDLAQSILSALDHAHRHGVVHRDIKPSNLLIRPDGTLKVTDFGLARLLDELSTQTQTQCTEGTPGYMAPERIRSLPLDRRSDIFSTAVVLYEALTGVHPFFSPNPAVTFARILGRKPPPPSKLADVPLSVDAAIMKALAKQPSLRFGEGAEFWRALNRRVGTPRRLWGPPVVAGPPTTRGKLQEIEPPRLLLTLWHLRRSGLLVVESDRMRMGVDLERGALQGIHGGPPQTYLGSVLVEQRLLSPAQRDELLELNPGHGDNPPLGELAIHHGYLDRAGVLAGLTRQVKRRIQALLELREGTYALYPAPRSRRGPGLDHVHLELAVNATFWSDAGLRRRTVERFLSEQGDASVLVGPEAEGVLRRFLLDPRFHRWLRAIPDLRVVEALDTGIVPPDDAAATLYLLWASGPVLLLPPEPPRSPHSPRSTE